MSFKTYNLMIIEGYISTEPELRHTADGKPVCNFSVAVESGSREDPRTTFIDITAWNRWAEFVDKYLSKGSGVFIEGKVDTDKWEDKTTGHKRSKLILNANFIRLPTSRGKNTKNQELNDPAVATAGNDSWGSNSNLDDIEF